MQQLGMIGLGRMGANMVRRLSAAGHRCVVHDVHAAAIEALVGPNVTGATTLEVLVRSLTPPRAVWLMVPAAIVDHEIALLLPLLEAGDIVIDGGNSHYHDDIRRAAELESRGIHYVDVGTSGGVAGLGRGYCLMIGGEPEIVAHLSPIFATLAPGAAVTDAADATSTLEKVACGAPGSLDMAEVASLSPAKGVTFAGCRAPAFLSQVRQASGGSASQGYLHCGPTGAGHFVKMVHNGIEYGVMSAYAEGMNILRNANVGKQHHEKDAETTPLRHPEHYRFDLDLPQIAEVWRHGSVISSWLLDLMADSLRNNPNLDDYAGRVSDSGEGRWTIAAAIDEGVPVPVISAALFARFQSRGNADYADRVLSAMRKQFGGHEEKKS